jgi:hypothetical protein
MVKKHPSRTFPQPGELREWKRSKHGRAIKRRLDKMTEEEAKRFRRNVINLVALTEGWGIPR